MQTLHCRWHEGYREINCTARAHQHSFWQTAQYESHPERGGTSRRCLPSWLSPDLNKKYATSDNLTVKMIRKSQSNCIFSRWKDKCVFNLLFWIPNFFKHSKIMVGEALLPLLPLTARHWSPRCFAGVCWLLGYLRQHLFCRALRLAFPYPAYAEHIQHGW